MGLRTTPATCGVRVANKVEDRTGEDAGSTRTGSSSVRSMTALESICGFTGAAVEGDRAWSACDHIFIAYNMSDEIL